MASLHPCRLLVMFRSSTCQGFLKGITISSVICSLVTLPNDITISSVACSFVIVPLCRLKAQSCIVLSKSWHKRWKEFTIGLSMWAPHQVASGRPGSHGWDGGSEDWLHWEFLLIGSCSDNSARWCMHAIVYCECTLHRCMCVIKSLCDSHAARGCKLDNLSFSVPQEEVKVTERELSFFALIHIQSMPGKLLVRPSHWKLFLVFQSSWTA